MEKNSPLVSICMPAYNAEKYIVEAVNSIITQSYQSWELIIVNDGSTDNTTQELSKVKDSRVKVYHQKNKGQCAAANKAYESSAGELVKFMDADDLISPHFIENQVIQLNGRDDVIASSAWGRFYEDDLDTFKSTEYLIIGDTIPIDWLVTALETKSAMMQCAQWLIPRKTLNLSGLWDESLSLINDLEFFIRVFLCAKWITFTEDAMLYYRSGLSSSLSNLKSRVGAESAYQSIDKGMNLILNAENSERTRKVAADTYQSYIYTFYPYHQDLIELAAAKVNALGGSKAKHPASGSSKLLQTLIGWKLTAKIKSSMQL